MQSTKSVLDIIKHFHPPIQESNMLQIHAKFASAEQFIFNGAYEYLELDATL